jgi:hypothetical protein
MRRSALHPLALRGSPSDSSRGKDEGLARADIKNRADGARLDFLVIARTALLTIARNV